MRILYGINLSVPQQKYELRRYKLSQFNEIAMYRLFLCSKIAVKLYTAVKINNIWRNFL